MSRVEAGQMALQRQDVELRPLLEGVLELGAPLAARHGGSLRGDYGAALRLRTDPVRLRQVLLNLVSNAIKYNRPGGTVRLTLAAAPGEALLRVRDDGIGMSPAQMAGLFQPFNRLGRESSAIEGTGIGLHLARQLVELLGGRLEIASEEGAGTEATLRLPLALLEAPPAPRAAPAALPTAADAAAPRGRVLYVEDNPVNALLVEQLLATWPQVELRIAPTGAEGLAAAAQWRPGQVRLVMQLPDMTGLELLAALQADAATRGLRVVALSANALPEDVAAARRAGVEAYWTKPIDFAQVLQGVAERLHAAEAARETALEAS
jgi:CheY-like chemotaxis protein/anti-sigma regulatory factor (Ser/Thr protein kinase)